MKIRNFCLTLKNNNIKYYLSQLPDIYRTCDVPIIIVPNNYFGYLIWCIYAWYYNLEDRNYNEYKKYLGTAYFKVIAHEPILIYCKYKSKYQLADTLFHELRHWYQQKYMKMFHTNANNYDIEISNKEYDNLPLEKDANTFAKKYCKKLGIKYATIKGESWILAHKSKVKGLK